MHQDRLWTGKRPVLWSEQFTAAQKRLTLFNLRQAIHDFKAKEGERKKHRKQMRTFMSLKQAGKQTEIYRQLMEMEFDITSKVKTEVEKVTAEHNDYLGQNLKKQINKESNKTRKDFVAAHEDSARRLVELQRLSSRDSLLASPGRG